MPLYRFMEDKMHVDVSCGVVKWHVRGPWKTCQLEIQGHVIDRVYKEFVDLSRLLSPSAAPKKPWDEVFAYLCPLPPLNLPVTVQMERDIKRFSMTQCPSLARRPILPFVLDELVQDFACGPPVVLRIYPMTWSRFATMKFLRALGLPRDVLWSVTAFACALFQPEPSKPEPEKAS